MNKYIGISQEEKQIELNRLAIIILVKVMSMLLIIFNLKLLLDNTSTLKLIIYLVLVLFTLYQGMTFGRYLILYINLYFYKNKKMFLFTDHINKTKYIVFASNLIIAAKMTKKYRTDKTKKVKGKYKYELEALDKNVKFNIEGISETIVVNEQIYKDNSYIVEDINYFIEDYLINKKHFYLEYI